MGDIYNIEATQGSTLLLNITCRDSNGDYINFGGYTSQGYVRYGYGSTGTLLNLNPQIHSSLVSGLIILSGRADDMASMKAGIYVYDIECSGSNNYTFKPIKGTFSVFPECSF